METKKFINLTFGADGNDDSSNGDQVTTDDNQIVKKLDFGGFIIEVSKQKFTPPAKTIEIQFGENGAVKKKDVKTTQSLSTVVVPNVNASSSSIIPALASSLVIDLSKVPTKPVPASVSKTAAQRTETLKTKPLVEPGKQSVIDLKSIPGPSKRPTSAVNGVVELKAETVAEPPPFTEADWEIFKQFLPQPQAAQENSSVTVVVDAQKSEDFCYKELLECSGKDLNINMEEFVCSLCEGFIHRRQGVVLKGCLHSFCKPCLVNAITNDYDTMLVVACPMKVEKCDSNLEDEEVRALLGDTYEAFVSSVMLNLDEKLKEQDNAASSGTIAAILNQDNYLFIKNSEVFECGICMCEIDAGEGVVLKNCQHQFCKDCLIESVKHSDDTEVKCPSNNEDGNCKFTIQEREIRGFAPPEVFEKHISKSVKLFESAHQDKTYHCKTPDCIGFIEKDANLRGFTCEVCEVVNCIGCKVIHTGMNCSEYEEKTNPNAKHKRENAESESAISNLVASDQAMWCPQCRIPVMKDEGCDFITCGACRLGICWRTKKPRQPFTKANGEVIDGCHCNFSAGKLCHPQCRNCH